MKPRHDETTARGETVARVPGAGITLACALVLCLLGVAPFWQAAGQTPVPPDSAASRPSGRPEGRRLVLTGNLGVQPRPFRVNAAPLVGLRFGRHTVAGLGPTYIYARDGLGGHSQPGPVHVYGGRVFASRRLSGQVFAQAEAEALNHPHSPAAGLRRWMLNPLAGVSWNIRIGQRSFIQLTALYNFNYQGDAFNRQIYNSPWVFRVGAGS